MDIAGNLDDSIVSEVKVFNAIEAEVDKLDEYGNFDDTNILIVLGKFEAEGLDVILIEAEVDEVNEDGNFDENLIDSVVSFVLGVAEVKGPNEVEAEADEDCNSVDNVLSVVLPKFVVEGLNVITVEARVSNVVILETEYEL